MTRSYGPFIDEFETWLDATPGDEDPESVLARIVAELDATSQRHSPWPDWLRLDLSAVLGFGLGTAATVIATLIGIQLISGTGVGGPGSRPPLPSTVSASPSTGLGSPAPRLVEFPGCPPYAPGTVPQTSPEPSDRGLIGLPPADSSPSAPEVGRLIDCWPVNGGRLPPYMGMVRLYADGRLIWNYYFDGGNATTGHIEQRLTPEGVELLRDLDNAAEKDPLRLRDWLPSTAWEDRSVRPYVPAWYGACLIANDGVGSDIDRTLAEKLDMLPLEVAELLRNREPVPGAAEAYGDPFDCLGLTTAEARELDAVLREAGFDQDEVRNRYLLEYHLDLDGGGPGTTTIAIWFEPVFPEGVIGCSSCG